MATKYRPGSAGAKEQKEAKVMYWFFGAITVAALLLEFVIPSILRDNVKAATTAWNVIGGILTAASFVPIVKAQSAGEEGAKGYTIAWGVLLALGFMCAAGWYGYTY